MVKHEKISYFKSENYPIISFSYSFICENISYQFLDSERQGNIEREMLAMQHFFTFFWKTNRQDQQQACYLVIHGFIQISSLIPYYAPKYLKNPTS